MHVMAINVYRETDINKKQNTCHESKSNTGILRIDRIKRSGKNVGRKKAY